MPIVYLAVTLVLVALFGWLINTYVPVPDSIKRTVNVVLALIVVGMFLWLINIYVPMAESIKAILNIVVVVATCVGVLQAVGLWNRVVRMWNDFTTSHRLQH